MSILARLPFSDQLTTALHFQKAFGLGVSQSTLLIKYLTAQLFPDKGDEIHLKETLEWLARAQDECSGQGVSCVYYLHSGWGVAYPETSGYILATYLVYADYSGDISYIDRALQIGDWEISIQAPNGGVYSSMILQQTRVFNTAQVILGWAALYERTSEKKYLQAALKAGEYLLNVQDEDGTWKKDTYCGARTYHAGVDWALLRLAEASGDDRFAVAAAKNLEWVTRQQLENGWFEQCGFNDDQPNMHVIAYTLRGLLECALLGNDRVNNQRVMAAAINGANPLCSALETQPIAKLDGMVPTSFDRNWRSEDKDSCLTGNAQLSCFLYLLTHHTNKRRYRDVADVVLSATKRTQLVDTVLLPLRGAIAGSYPLSHGYLPNGYPNWAAKFFADALLMKLNFDKKLVVPA
jgi:hypothetical protein